MKTGDFRPGLRTLKVKYAGRNVGTLALAGNGKNPGEKELLSVGLKAGMSRMVCMKIISDIKSKAENL